MANPKSPAMQLLTHVWQHMSSRTSRRQRLDGMRQALRLAIQMGLPFGLEDFVWLTTNTRASYYDTTPFGMDLFTVDEGYYPVAIHAHNTSACLAFEHWKKRTPFFWQGARLYVGAGLDWDEQRVLVTSFDDQAGTLTACAYGKITRYGGSKGSIREQGNGTPTQRYTLTPAVLRAARTQEDPTP